MKIIKKKNEPKLIISSKFIELPHLYSHNRSQVLNKYSSIFSESSHKNKRRDKDEDDDQLDQYLFSNQQILKNMKKFNQSNQGQERKVTAYVPKHRKLEKINYSIPNQQLESKVEESPPKQIEKKNRIKTVIQQARKVEEVQSPKVQQKVLQFRYHPNSLFDKISSLRQHKNQFMD